MPACTHLHMCAHAYTCVHTHAHTYLHTCAHTCAHVYTGALTHTCMHTLTHTHAHTCTRVYRCTHTHVHAYTYAHACAHTRMHAHRRSTGVGSCRRALSPNSTHHTHCYKCHLSLSAPHCPPAGDRLSHSPTEQKSEAASRRYLLQRLLTVGVAFPPTFFDRRTWRRETLTARGSRRPQGLPSRPAAVPEKRPLLCFCGIFFPSQ